MNTNLRDSGLLSDYESLAAFEGEPGIFWIRTCEYVRSRLHADSVCLFLGGGTGEIRVLGQAPAGSSKRLAKAGVPSSLPEVDSPIFAPMTGTLGRRFQALLLPGQDGIPPIWTVIEGMGEKELAETVSKELRSLCDTYQARRQTRYTSEKLVTLTEVLDLGLALGETAHFKEAALRVCNELAAQMRASRVSLSWTEGQDLKLMATSHGGRISANSEEARTLQQVMEEATDQDNEVAYPELRGSSAISREHRQFSTSHEGLSVLSVPLRSSEEAVGAICLERAEEEGRWKVEEAERIRLLGDLVAPRLEELHAKTGWLGRRFWRFLRKKSGKVLGYEHTGWKLTAILICGSLLALSLIRIEHKIRAPFILKTDAASLISAPFPGFIEEAHYHLGDIVQKGQFLVGLDRKEMLLEEADTEALLNKSQRESRSFEAEGELAQMLVSKAETQQAQARLAIIQHRLELTRIVAPFEGVVVEGDLRERLSSPVQTGEPLLKIVQLKELFGQLQVDDRDISYLAEKAEGELAFTSRPGEKFEVKIDRFEPVAEIRPEGTVFLLRAQVLSEPQSWWRPGMSGICKINAGERSLLWIAGHRLWEALRLRFWI